ncbi:MAG: 2-amino-4-hydroxy-6-hydroxymethyldihydropteridine diphosphokinase [Bacteroidota bacterium]
MQREKQEGRPAENPELIGAGSEEILLLTGSNLGDRGANLNAAIAGLEAEGVKVLRQSSIHITAPWGKTDQPDFFNQALVCQTEFGPEELLKIIHKTEQAQGRLRLEKWGARTLDIDILLFGSRIINLPHLIVPHPFLPDREFALAPAAEIAGNMLHPLIRKTVTVMLNELSSGRKQEV